MPMQAYLDASALVKRYVPEIGTPLVNAIFDHLYPQALTCATLALLEVASVLVRQHNDRRLTLAAFNQSIIDLQAELIDNADFSPMSVADVTVLAALDLVLKHHLNASDAIILQSALFHTPHSEFHLRESPC